MSKTLILTGYDGKFAPLGDLTTPLMLSYANRHRFDFLCVRTYPDGEPAYWHKVPRIVTAIEQGYDRVIWIDADMVVANPEYAPPWDKGFHASKDWGVDATTDEHFSMCCIIAGKDSVSLFRWLLNHKADWISKPFPEQAPMRHLYANHVAAKEIMKIHPRRVLNAVPIEVHASVVEPWQPGDWLCHLTMLSIEARVALFHKIHAKP